MSTRKIREALALLGDRVDESIAEEAHEELNALERMANTPMFLVPTPAEKEATLRDTFAAAALTGLLANPRGFDPANDSTEKAARVMYAFADAMLAAREGK